MISYQSLLLSTIVLNDNETIEIADHSNTPMLIVNRYYTSRLTIVSREAKKKQPYATNE